MPFSLKHLMTQNNGNGPKNNNQNSLKLTGWMIMQKPWKSFP
jgi:hypothetical protein